MYVLKKAYCRIFQACFKVAIPFLPYKTPKILNSTADISNVLEKNNINKVMVVTDAGVRKLGLLDRMLMHLEHHNITYVIYDKTVANPTNINVEEARNLYIQEKCQAFIGFGGGSSIDCAKAIAARIAKPKQSLNRMEGILRVLKKLPVVVAVPTTAGTGSETTLAAVITNASTRNKYAINDFSLIPPYAVLDPKTTLSLPPFLTACTGMDALTHAIEAYIGRSTTKQTRKYALEAIQLIFENIDTVYTNGNDLEARRNMLLASYKAGCAFTVSYVGYVHAIAHSLGGKYNVPHGYANAVLLPIVLRKYGDTIEKKMYEIGVYTGICKQEDSYADANEKVIQHIEKMKQRFSIGNTFSELKEEDIPSLAKYADREANPLYPVPKLMDEKQLEEIYRMVLMV